MAKRSRQDFEVVQLGEVRPKIEAPPSLSASEKQLFERIVAQASPQHFVMNDIPLLASFVGACSLVEHAHAAAMRSPDHLKDWERACKTMIALSRQLRLAPIGRVDPKSLTRQLTGRSYASFPDLERIEQAKAGTGPLRDWKARS